MHCMGFKLCQSTHKALTVPAPCGAVQYQMDSAGLAVTQEEGAFINCHFSPMLLTETEQE